MDIENGQVFIKNLAQFVRTHEKALANALQLRRQTSTTGAHGSRNTAGGASSSPATPHSPLTIGSYPPQTQTLSPPQSTSSTLAAALSLPSLSFTSHSLKPAKLALTPHHLFYLLSRFEDLGIPVGPMNVRSENLHSDTSPANYVSFLRQSQRAKGRSSDRDSIRSVSSVRSVMSGMSSLWSSFGLGSSNSAAKTERQKLALQADLKYLYSAFTKIPCLRLAPDRKARLIEGYEEFPFDTAVPLHSFKNISALELIDVDFRQFFGWDRMADQLRSLTVKRAGVEDVADLLANIVLDDMEKRRRRSSKAQASPVLAWAPPNPLALSTTTATTGPARSNSAPTSPKLEDAPAHSSSPQSAAMARGNSEGSKAPQRIRPQSRSPSRPTSRTGSSHTHTRSGGGGAGPSRIQRSGSGSSHSSAQSAAMPHSSSTSNLLMMGMLPASKWRFLKHLSLAENSLTFITASSLSPLANSLHSLDLSGNLFSQIPDCLATLTSLRALNLSGCMIDSLHSLLRNPLPAITALNLRGNRLISLAGVERLFSLERLDLRDNRLTDPIEMARLTGIPEMREMWLSGNPFIRTHPQYRITVFNLFRTAPGYAEDVTIDSTGPGYSERRQLADRVPEPPSVPVVRPPPQEYRASPISTPSIPSLDHLVKFGDVQANHEEPLVNLSPVQIAPIPIIPHSAVIRPVSREYHRDFAISPTRDRPELRSTQSASVTSGSYRRRKGAKRRIVELSRSESRSPPASKIEDPFIVEPKAEVTADKDVAVAKPIVERPPPKSEPAPPTPPAKHVRIDITPQPETTIRVVSPVLPDDPSVTRRNSLPAPPPRLDTTVPNTMTPSIQATLATPIAKTPMKESQDWSISGEIYKKKIEALRNEVGNGWLSVLSEEGWDGQRGAGNFTPGGDFSPASTIRPSPTTPKASAQHSIVSGGRTLG
ncbi:MAG: hypothetical protein M1829_003655 [Trizodia sp. TS-e1964]|nr:MAG: hypothetical protein M1829_003655 [Trizodia sp. TS-e1964]